MIEVLTLAIAGVWGALAQPLGVLPGTVRDWLVGLTFLTVVIEWVLALGGRKE